MHQSIRYACQTLRRYGDLGLKQERGDRSSSNANIAGHPGINTREPHTTSPLFSISAAKEDKA